MHFFHLDAEDRYDEETGRRTWHVVADSLSKAQALAPDSYTVTGVSAQLAAMLGSGRSL